MKALGTILPTREGLERADRLAARQEKDRERKGDALLCGCEKRVVGGEVRWYDTEDRYAIVSRRSGDVLWFQVTADGDVRIPRR